MIELGTIPCRAKRQNLPGLFDDVDCFVTPRIKKLIGAIAILIWLPLYAFVAMGIGVHLLPHAHWFAALLYYALAGTLWIVPIGLMLPWMHREGRQSGRQ